MDWKQILTSLLFAGILISSCSDNSREKIGKTEVVIETSRGKITLRLYDDTPLHRDNFIRMIKDGVYDGILWNRIVPQGTIQSGEPTLTVNGAPPSVDVSKYKHTIPPEILYPRYCHKAGALAMARQPDSINVNRESSGTHFYIVTGKVYTRSSLSALWNYRLDTESDFKYGRMPESHKHYYTTKGGTPHLDGDYTIFGEVVDGMNVVESIGRIRVDALERPIKKVYIKKVYVKE